MYFLNEHIKNVLSCYRKQRMSGEVLELVVWGSCVWNDNKYMDIFLYNMTRMEVHNCYVPVMFQGLAFLMFFYVLCANGHIHTILYDVDTPYTRCAWEYSKYEINKVNRYPNT